MSVIRTCTSSKEAHPRTWRQRTHTHMHIQLSNGCWRKTHFFNAAITAKSDLIKTPTFSSSNGISSPPTSDPPTAHSIGPPLLPCWSLFPPTTAPQKSMKCISILAKLFVAFKDFLFSFFFDAAKMEKKKRLKNSTDVNSTKCLFRLSNEGATAGYGATRRRNLRHLELRSWGAPALMLIGVPEVISLLEIWLQDEKNTHLWFLHVTHICFFFFSFFYFEDTSIQARTPEMTIKATAATRFPPKWDDEHRCEWRGTEKCWF